MNQLPSSVLINTSPYALLFQQSPNYLKLRIFGCACYPWLRPYTINTSELRSKECVFLDYSLTQSAYLCLDRSCGCVYVSRHVQFPQPTPQAPLISATSLPPPSFDSHRRLNTDTTLSSSSQTTDDVLSTDDTQVDIEKWINGVLTWCTGLSSTSNSNYCPWSRYFNLITRDPKYKPYTKYHYPNKLTFSTTTTKHPSYENSWKEPNQKAKSQTQSPNHQKQNHTLHPDHRNPSSTRWKMEELDSSWDGCPDS